jgi:hypothetical protein
MSKAPWKPQDDPPDPVSPAPLRDALLELAAELLAEADREELNCARLRGQAKRLGHLSVVYGTCKPERRQMQPLIDRGLPTRKTA